MHVQRFSQVQLSSLIGSMHLEILDSGYSMIMKIRTCLLGTVKSMRARRLSVMAKSKSSLAPFPSGSTATRLSPPSKINRLQTP